MSDQRGREPIPQSAAAHPVSENGGYRGILNLQTAVPDVILIISFADRY